MNQTSREKLKQAVHFICHVAQGLTLGSIRLNKILFYADKETFCKTLEPLIADEYIRGPQGPHLADLRSIIDELKKERVLSVTTRNLGKRSFTDYISLRSPSTDLFTEKQLQLIEETTVSICTDYKAHEISEETHNAIWRMAGDKEPMPLAAQLCAQFVKPSKEILRWAEHAGEAVS